MTDCVNDGSFVFARFVSFGCRPHLKDTLVIKLSGKIYEGGLIFAPYIASILNEKHDKVL